MFFARQFARRTSLPCLSLTDRVCVDCQFWFQWLINAIAMMLKMAYFLFSLQLVLKFEGSRMH